MDKFPALTAEKVAELKKEHSGETLHVNEIRLPRQAGGERVKVVWREPTYDDWDAAQAADANAVDDVQAGNRHLAESIIVWPDARHVTLLTELPGAINRWMAQEILPFFGNGSKIPPSREL